MRLNNCLIPGNQSVFGRGIFCLLVLLLLISTKISAGVLVAPTVVFMSDKNRTGRLNVQNPTDKPIEVTISFGFGLPESDSLGNVRVVIEDSNVVDPRSALDWVRAFPRKVLVPPSGEQVVRLVARPPKGLPEGEYWARIIVRSQQGQTTIPTAGEGDGITTTLNMIIQTAIMLKYRNGIMNAELEVTDIQTSRNETKLKIVVAMANRGNASYLGRLTCRVLDADKRQVAIAGTDLAVYRNLKRKLEIPYVPGEYKMPFEIEVKISSEGRRDIAREFMVFGNEINRVVYLD